MTALLRIPDSIAFELRWLSLIGVFQYGKYLVSSLASAQFVLFMILMGIQHTITILYLETIEQLTDLLYVVGIYIVVCCKLYGLLPHRHKVSVMIDTLNDELMLPADWSHVYRSEFVEALRHVRMATRWYLFVVYSAITSVVISTVLDRKLMFFCYFPFETRYEYSLQGYWIAYSYQVVYGIFLVQTSVHLDIVIATLLHCAAVKLKILRLECGKLCSFYRCVDILNAVKTAIAFHIETVRYVADIEIIFSFALFVQCCLSVFSICVVLLKAIFLDITAEPEQVLGVIIVLMAFTGQIFFYCHYGNQIQDESTNLFTSIYLCEWYNLNCSCVYRGQPNRNHTTAMRRSILIFLERAKRPTIITAGRFFKLTYESFIMICKTGYQTFAVFRDVLK